MAWQMVAHAHIYGSITSVTRNQGRLTKDDIEAARTVKWSLQIAQELYIYVGKKPSQSQSTTRRLAGSRFRTPRIDVRLVVFVQRSLASSVSRQFD